MQDRLRNGNNWFFTSTISESLAGGISGSTFLFPPNVNEGLPISSPAQLSIEDHSELVASTAGYTSHFGANRAWFATLQANYGSGFPVQFEDANVKGLGVTLDVQNILNHQYVIKIANGFNTTQIANSRAFLLRLTEPF